MATAPKPIVQPRLFDARALLATEIPEPKWAVPGFLCEGATILAGKPKIGKSWLALGLAVAVASGGRALGQIEVEKGGVLYLALEDTPRRLKGRLRMILRDSQAPDGLTFATTWPRLGEGGTEQLLSWLDSHSNSRLVVVDTLARMRAGQSRNANLYAEDYEAIATLKRLADHASAAMVIVTHTRKMGAEDPLDSVSGTAGQTGAADSTMVLRRDRNHRDSTLFLTGRDIEEREIPLRFDSATASWTIPGSSLSQERQELLDLLKVIGPSTPKVTADRAGKPYEAVKQLMWRMVNDGSLRKDSSGKYSVPLSSANRDNPITVVTPVTEVLSGVTG